MDLTDTVGVVSYDAAGLASELGDIQLIKTRFDGVEYDIQTTRNGTRHSFFLLFEKDADGRWKIANF